MSEVMKPVAFRELLEWIITEYKQEKSIFGIAESNFFHKQDKSGYRLWGEYYETALGPAAGPHTQCAQNIVAAYLTGARFFELKTVQVMDELDVPKPCIEAEHEGYNTEWSTELTVEEAYQEYVKAWFILHYLKYALDWRVCPESGFIFNMSVGYDLAGIKTTKIDNFIEYLKEAGEEKFFLQCQEEMRMVSGENIVVPSQISRSITLSTMHGCPPAEQESICRYLMGEKGLHTFVKLNPTLLGYDFVNSTLQKLGFNCPLSFESFANDLQYEAAQKMLGNLLAYARERKLTFGVKLSNTLPVQNKKELLPGDEMYMSGKALYPLTVNLAAQLYNDFGEELTISYCGGAEADNIAEISNCGIHPITLATNLLKPGGYGRLRQMAEILENLEQFPKIIDKLKLQETAAKALLPNARYTKYSHRLKTKNSLPVWDCAQASCSNGCPVEQDVPAYIREVKAGNYAAALEIIARRNPLPHITGYICEHPCRMHCTRIDYESPLMIRELKKEAVLKGYQEFLPQVTAVETISVNAAVIGGGPAGLAAAYFLRKQGVSVTVFEKETRAGGLVRNVIPGFRLPDDVIDRDIELIRHSGVEITCNEQVSVEQLQKRGYKYILLAVGASESKDMELAGDGKGLLSGLDFLKLCKAGKTEQFRGSQVIVAGGGNSAMDSARAAMRLPEVKNVTLIYRRTEKEMPADREEFDNALEEGVVFKELLQPVRLVDHQLYCQPMETGKPDSRGRRSVHPSGEESIAFAADLIISAIGEEVDRSFLVANGINLINNFKTNLENVYLIGDAFRGPSSVVQAMADGMKAAEEILKKENIAAKWAEPLVPEKSLEANLADLRKRKAEISSITSESVESDRCLECDILCNKCVEVCPNRANIALKIDSPLFRNFSQILHIDKLCNKCGNCETFCPFNGAPYKDKFTLFHDRKAFLESDNDGIYLDINGEAEYRFQRNTSEPGSREAEQLEIFIAILTERYDYLLRI
ncbi:MAG: putative selenate reductase subunit YgfK [Candidatus Cloacimonetes bacterium]|nr:putative selenate reductase subunit YgfK [Candidatus Cloacimonadota bacterium]